MCGTACRKGKPPGPPPQDKRTHFTVPPRLLMSPQLIAVRMAYVPGQGGPWAASAAEAPCAGMSRRQAGKGASTIAAGTYAMLLRGPGGAEVAARLLVHEPRTGGAAGWSAGPHRRRHRAPRCDSGCDHFADGAWRGCRGAGAAGSAVRAGVTLCVPAALLLLPVAPEQLQCCVCTADSP